MAFMGYDPERIGWLREAMRTAATGLAAIRSSDPAIATSIARIRTVQRSLEDTWLPVLDGLRACAVMSDFTPVHLDGADARTSVLFMLQGYGWQVTADPGAALGDTSQPVTAAEARAIGALLSRLDGGDLLDSDAEIAWLAARLRVIAGDPHLLAELEVNLDAPWVLAVLGDERLAAAQDGRTGQIGQLDAIIAGVVAALPAAASLLDELDPYAAALVLRDLRLDGTELAAACQQILLRWRNPPDDTGDWPDWIGPTFTADVLFPLLVADPAAAQDFLRRAAGHPDIVFRTTDDGELVGDLLVTGTDPAHASVAAAGDILVPILEWLDAESSWFDDGMIGGGYDVRDLLGAWIAPWLLQFQARPEDWDWSSDRGEAALRFVLADGASFDSLVRAMHEWQTTMFDHPFMDAEGYIDDLWLGDITKMLANLRSAMEAEEVDDAKRARFWIDLVIGVGVNTATSLVRGTGAGALASTLLPPTVAEIEDRLAGIGWFPASVDDAARSAHATRVQQATTAGVVAITAFVMQMIAAGELPADALDGLSFTDDGSGTVDEVRDTVVDFVHSLRDQCAPAVFNAMVAVADAFLTGDLVADA